jgi:hypothetical protein
VKIARNSKIPDSLTLYRGVSAQFPPNFYKVDDNGCRGFAEWGFMSTTADKEIAIAYSGVKDGQPTATVLKIKTSSVNRPACIADFSQYVEEKEYLWVPLSFMQPEGSPMWEASPYGVLQTIHVTLSANGTAATTEDLLGKKKQLHIKGFETLLDDLKVALLNLSDGQYGSYRTIAGQLSDEISDDATAVLQKHKDIKDVKYTDANVFNGLNRDMLDTFRFGHSKLKLWLEGVDDNKSVLETPLRTSHRLLVAHRKRLLAKMADSAAEKAARDLCVLMGLVRTSVEDTNEMGETRLMQAAADDESLNALRLLIQAQADVNATTPQGHTAAIRAAQNGNLACLEILMEVRADVDIAHESGATALFFAAQTGHHHCLKVLIDAKCRVDVPITDGSTPLLAAVEINYIECVDMLVQARADVNSVPASGATPIYVAAARNYIECLKILKMAGADATIPFKGKSPVQIAREKGHTGCERELQAASAADKPAE